MFFKEEGIAVFKEILCQSACHKLKRRFPFAYELNPYRGCQHGCPYCYAVYSHDYLGGGSFYDEIHVKTNIAEHLERELSSPSWKREIISFGGVTDCYQPAEARYQLMPELLRIMIKYKSPCIICTKSDLILRDYDLIAELSRHTYVNVACTITCADDAVQRKIEPHASSSANRFGVLKTFSQTQASTGLHVMPIIPYLTDSCENIEALFAQARDSRAAYVLPGVMYLRGATRRIFFDFIAREFPNLSAPLGELYHKGGADKEYKDKLYLMVDSLRHKYELSSSYSAPIKAKLSAPEETLFD